MSESSATSPQTPHHRAKWQAQRARCLQQRLRANCRLQPAMIALNKVLTRSRINDDWQKIVRPLHFSSIEIDTIFDSAFLQKSITSLESDFFMVAANQKDAVGILQLQSKQRVQHFDSIRAAIGVVPKEDHIEICAGYAEFAPITLYIQPPPPGLHGTHVHVRLS